jgi:hypothetical protein
MNREEMEKMFYEKFTWDNLYEVKQFIFETIIPEVLKGMLKEDNKFHQTYVNDFNKWIKQKVKELYNITL